MTIDKRQIRRRQCGKKQQFTTLADAENATRNANRKGSRVSAYACKFCGAYHIGHTPWHIRQAMKADDND